MGVSLLIDATSDITYLFLINNNELIDKFSKQNNKDLSHSLIKYIDSLLKANNYEFKDINNVYLIYGPGKFSAMRIGMVVAKTIVIINKCNFYIVDKFDYIAEKNSICVIKSDGNKSFICEYNDDGLKVDVPRLLPNDDISVALKAKKHLKLIKEDNLHDNVINKLKKFIKTNDEFELEYFKEPC